MSSYVSTVKHAAPRRSGKKYFTLEEAQRALTLVRRIAIDVQATQALRLRLNAELSAGFIQLTPGRQDMLLKQFENATGRLEDLMQELSEIGVELKDPARALMDFPCRHQGRDVLLCWKAGELTITHWHECDDGFASRKSVALLRP